MSDLERQKIENAGSDMESRLVALETQMQAVLKRNQKVEENKAWETSRTRLFIITIITYVTMVLVFSVLHSSQPLRDALVPTTGFFLSTLSLPFVRRVWDRRKKAKSSAIHN